MQYISSDTNVWIDFVTINKTEIPFRLPYTYIMSDYAVEDELLSPPGLGQKLISYGLVPVSITIIVESVDAEQISDPDGIPLENRIDLAGEDGKQYEVKGNIEITYTNKKGLVPVVLRKVGYTNTDPQEQTYPLVGAKFKIHEGSISGDCVTSEVGGEEISEFTSAGADAVFFSGELKMGVRYYLEETEIPAGYNAPAGNYYFTITENGITLNCDVPTGQSSYNSWIERQTTGGVTGYTISIRNVAGVLLPSTGGPGRGAFYLPSILLTGLAGAGTLMKKKKKT